MLAGMACFFWLAARPTAWPVVLIQRLASSHGQHLPAIAGIVLGSLLAAFLVWLPLVFFVDGQAGQRKKAAIKAAKAAMEVDRERARLERKERGFRDTGSMVDDMSGKKAERSKQATPGFIFALVGAGVLIVAAAAYVLR